MATLLDQTVNTGNYVLGEGISTVEWGKSFISKYADKLLLVLLIFVAGKMLKIRI